jgi:hypothetical protein
VREVVEKMEEETEPIASKKVKVENQKNEKE